MADCALDKKYHVIITVNGGVAEWQAFHPDLEVLKIDYDNLESGACPVCNVDLVHSNDSGEKTLCPECTLDWGDGAALDESDYLKTPPDFIYAPCQWEVIQENLVKDSNGHYWVYGGNSIRVVGDNSEDGGYYAESFADALWVLFNYDYIDDEQRVQQVTQTWKG